MSQFWKHQSVQITSKCVRGLLTVWHGHSAHRITELLILFPEGGLPPGQVVQVQNDTNRDRWYVRITDGRVQGDSKDPFIAGGQWLKANSTTEVERKENHNVYIASIIAIVDK
jgi:hypothetical protein